jgi:hypothetical protein
LGNQRARDHLEDPGVNLRIILKYTFKKCNGDMGWIDLSQNRTGEVLL